MGIPDNWNIQVTVKENQTGMGRILRFSTDIGNALTEITCAQIGE